MTTIKTKAKKIELPEGGYCYEMKIDSSEIVHSFISGIRTGHIDYYHESPKRAVVAWGNNSFQVVSPDKGAFVGMLTDYMYEKGEPTHLMLTCRACGEKWAIKTSQYDELIVKLIGEINQDYLSRRKGPIICENEEGSTINGLRNRNMKDPKKTVEPVEDPRFESAINYIEV